MRRDQLEVGDVVQVNKDGVPFEARITEFLETGIRFEPVPTWPTWRTARFRQVVRRVDPPLGKRRRQPKDEHVASSQLYPTQGRKVQGVRQPKAAASTT